ncbi:MAG: thioredoxin, partial [Candidatus Eremiobacteraeota bacterium]|nr:thioredoxin [Candidatus Eremiobacteraeota bacterium]
MNKPTRADALAAGLGLAGALLVPAVARAASARSLEPLLAYGTWLDARPNPESLRGRVVLVDVFTFGCYNCQNVTPNL